MHNIVTNVFYEHTNILTYISNYFPLRMLEKRNHHLLEFPFLSIVLNPLIAFNVHSVFGLWAIYLNPNTTRSIMHDFISSTWHVLNLSGSHATQTFNVSLTKQWTYTWFCYEVTCIRVNLEQEHNGLESERMGWFKSSSIVIEDVNVLQGRVFFCLSKQKLFSH